MTPLLLRANSEPLWPVLAAMDGDLERDAVLQQEQDRLDDYEPARTFRAAPIATADDDSEHSSGVRRVELSRLLRAPARQEGTQGAPGIADRDTDLRGNDATGADPTPVPVAEP